MSTVQGCVTVEFLVWRFLLNFHCSVFQREENEPVLCLRPLWSVYSVTSAGESWWCTAPACLHKTRNQTPHHESHCRSVSECVFVKAATALLSIKLSCIPKCFCHIDLLKRKPHNRDDAWKYSVSCWNRTSVRFIGGWVTQPPREGLLIIKPQTDELAGINMWRSPLSQLSVRGWSTDKKECANEKRSYKWIQK